MYRFSKNGQSNHCIHAVYVRAKEQLTYKKLSHCRRRASSPLLCWPAVQTQENRNVSNVTLRAVDQHNYEQICDLEVFEEQEDYVASNLWSLVQASYNPTCTARAIYDQELPVGLFLWSAETPRKVSIWRFMVDKQHQKRGIGREALGLLLEELRQIDGLARIEICYHPTNPVAGEFYASFGFAETGMDEDGEDMLAVIELPPRHS